jgi:uncharacterized repeat protein (TIGR03803 family)
MKLTIRRNFPALISCGAAVLAATFFLTLAAATSVFAQAQSVLYSFCQLKNCVDGMSPAGNLVMDANGYLYGTTGGGGWNAQGTVFRVSPDGSERVLHSFGVTSGDGYFPSPGLVIDKRGNLYGTTKLGGTNDTINGGGGTVYKITPAGAETILYNFGATSTDGTNPQAGLAADAKGNLYGTTLEGGENGYGTIFKLAPSGSETILYNFPNDGADRFQPDENLTLDNKGDVYGVTSYGGTNNAGLAFEVSADGAYTVLYNFGESATDASIPKSSLTLDSNGNLYGTSQAGGSNNEGTVFELSPKANGSWTENVLYSFSTSAGSVPEAGVTFATGGSLYGTTYDGGSGGCGTVFELSPNGTLTTLFTFNGTDGAYPNGNLLDSAGNYYGVTFEGGAQSGGTLYMITTASSAHASGENQACVF